MIIQLLAAGTSFVLDARGPRPPVVLYWGFDLGDLGDADLAALAGAAVPAVPPGSPDEPLRLSLLPPDLDQGWSGRPAIAGWWPGDGIPVARFQLRDVRHEAPGRVLVDLGTTDGRLLLTTEIELSGHGVLRLRHHLHHAGTSTFRLSALDVVLPVPEEAAELLDFSGLWACERRPQRLPLRHGIWSREGRHGRPGHHDPYLLMAVLDDGWFTGRTDDCRALGDWYVDGWRWPRGLHPLIERVHERGMDFGIWVEPEMVSPDSALARAHPDWVLGGPAGATWRHQWVLDPDSPEALANVLERLSALPTAYSIAFLKWDHNRDLLQPGATHRQTVALYRLLAEGARGLPRRRDRELCLRGRPHRPGHPGTARPGLDLRHQRPAGPAADPALDRCAYPAEFLGGHLGAPVAHITGRTSALSFRFATALFGCAASNGSSPAPPATNGRRPRGGSPPIIDYGGCCTPGTVVRSGADDAAQFVHGVVGADRQRAIYALVASRAAEAALPPPIRFVGLDPQICYSMRPLSIGSQPRAVQDAAPAWLTGGGVTLPGRALAEVGLLAPLSPEQAALFTVEAHPAADASPTPDPGAPAQQKGNRP